ncbi:MAG TPA: hypothetical protein VK688_09945, partial [Gemmatimonadales bacterium]|nr:hypothetical protein [Gemmatimonadales bacterium]
MTAVVALLESRSAALALRRSIPKGGPRVISCRTIAGLERALETRLVDAIVLAPHTTMLGALADLRRRLPAIPVVAYAPFRPEDGELLSACERQTIAGFAVEGVDDPVVGDLVIRCSLTTSRRRAMADGPRLLRL